MDAVPVVLATTDVDEIVETVARLAPSFGGINLEDISAPRCFEIERKLHDRLDIPAFHNDQHGTAVVTLAALRNAARLTGRNLADLRAVIAGAGAAGIAISKILVEAGVGDVAVADRRGIVHRDRDDLTAVKHDIALRTNRTGLTGRLHKALTGADVFIGVWRRNGSRERGRHHGQGRLHLHHGQPHARDPPRGRAHVRGRRRNRSQRLPEPDQQRPRLPRHSPGLSASAPTASPPA